MVLHQTDGGREDGLDSHMLSLPLSFLCYPVLFLLVMVLILTTANIRFSLLDIFFSLCSFFFYPCLSASQIKCALVVPVDERVA